jgi:CRISPR-associated endonuclease/helicase Cas3
LLIVTFWAHSDRSGIPPEAPGSEWQPLAEHLQNVASLARQLARSAAPENAHFHDLAEWCGLLHDYGKYTDGFQKMIVKGGGRCPHAIHGAVMAFSGPARNSVGLSAPHIALAIAGHHAGMPDFGEMPDRVKKKCDEAIVLLDRAAADLPRIGQLLADPPKLEKISSGRFDLLTRMLLSCLVDADRLDTARRENVQSPLDAANRLDTLLAYLGELAANSPEGTVKNVRSEVLENCLDAASLTDRIFSLSVPTSGGKTLSAMAFALKRAALHPERYRRVIVVIPYLSIIEQNAEVYARVFGADSVLEHHSGSFARLLQEKDHFTLAPEDDEHYRPPSFRLETENWDAPLIVTTSVRFFESLFSNHPSDLRRVHNIARSIVILDEVQVLPRNLLGPLLGMIDELSSHWGCSFVLSSATKPAFEKPASAGPRDLRWPPGKVREIVRSPDLHTRLRRVSIDWRIKDPVDWPQVATWMQDQDQALCVVNLRDHAAKLFDELVPRVKAEDSVFHLSTRMCAAHRLEVIAEIRRRLRERLPCLVVSTQLIEAGVDLDFPTAFRALGPLDSIVQVAGRIDREGLLTAAAGRPAGQLVVFKPLDHRTPPNEYATATDMTETLAKTHSIQPADIGVMTMFFDAYYGNADLGSKFVGMREKAQFKSLADEFEMISSRTLDAFVPYGGGKYLIEELLSRRRLDGDLRRRLQRYVVGLQPAEFRNAKHSALFELPKESDIWIASDAAYSRTKGLLISLDPGNLIH